MSFSFDQRDSGVANEIVSHANKVLFFAAASNNRRGETLEDISFPARMKGNVLCVNSCEYNGNKSSFSPEGREGRANIAAIGEGVEAALLLSSNQRQNVGVKTGTSCSTPIVAGLAALILDVSKQRLEESVEKPQDLLQTRVMERILLKHMSKDHKDKTYNSLTPFDFFNRDLGKLVQDINSTMENMDNED